MALPCAGKIWLDGWAGRHSYDVTVIRKTPKRYEVRNDSDKPFMVAGRLLKCWPGQTVLVPCKAVTFNPPNSQKP